MMNEREKRLLNYILQKELITEEDLEGFDFFDFEIEEAKDNRYWREIYYNHTVEDKDEIDRIDEVLVKALGENWKYRYDYKEGKRKNRFELQIYLTDEEYETIHKAYREGR